MTRPVIVQMGLFGGCNELAEMHEVAAHTRVLSDGSEVFVGSHLRWNRGRQPPRAPRPCGVEAPLPGQLGLFLGERPAEEGPPGAQHAHGGSEVAPEVRYRGTAEQLPLW